ncbi:MAG: DNA polymerase IV [Mollicutes bacterium]|nr:DNA polymerase IV [Mollicutes bacterium]
MDRIIFHIDVNNAFLSWSAKYLLQNGSKLDIREIPSVIGGDEQRRAGIVLAKSTIAKKFGIVTGETLYSARRKCPGLKIYPPMHTFYQEQSNLLFNYLKNYSPDIETFSIDECFLDYGKVKKLYGDQLSFANKLKNEIKEKLGFTVNIGIGNNKLCAKMASDFSKPNQVHTLYMNEVEEKIWPLPIEELFGIGRKTSPKLHDLNINYIRDLANADYSALYPYFKNQTAILIDKAKGIDNEPVISERPEYKGVSNTKTLPKDLTTKEEIFNALRGVAENIGISLRKDNRYAKVITIILKDCYFKVYTHQKKLKNATNLNLEIFNIAKKLVNEIWDETPIRLVGIRADNLVNELNYQVSLFDSFEDVKKLSKLDETVDKLKDKYGVDIIKTANSDK